MMLVLCRYSAWQWGCVIVLWVLNVDGAQLYFWTALIPVVVSTTSTAKMNPASAYPVTLFDLILVLFLTLVAGGLRHRNEAAACHCNPSPREYESARSSGGPLP